MSVDVAIDTTLPDCGASWWLHLPHTNTAVQMLP